MQNASLATLARSTKAFVAIWQLPMTEDVAQSNPVSAQYATLRHALLNHGLYRDITTRENLGIFMEHHVYAVWDFMSLVKSLQHAVAPAASPWVPPTNPRLANFVNQLVLDEESDGALTVDAGTTHASHFEGYLLAMAEAGADVRPVRTFVSAAGSGGIKAALKLPGIPVPARRFMRFTFDVIECGEVHLLTAVLAYGREDLVPRLFQSIQSGLGIGPESSPNLHAYLERHTRLDADKHGPLAIQLLNELCDGSAQKRAGAVDLAEKALAARLEFWNGIQAALVHPRGPGLAG